MKVVHDSPPDLETDTKEPEEEASIVHGDPSPDKIDTGLTPSASSQATVARNEVDVEGDSANFWDSTITISKTRKEDKFGLTFETSKSVPVVQQIGDGVVSAWNARHPDNQLYVGDVLLEINGVPADSSALASLAASQEAVVKRRRHLRFVAEVPKDGLLGLDCHKRTMQVKLVKPGGAVWRYNRACEPGKELRENDRIVQVNTVSSSSADMLEEVRYCSGSMKFHVARQ